MHGVWVIKGTDKTGWGSEPNSKFVPFEITEQIIDDSFEPTTEYFPPVDSDPIHKVFQVNANEEKLEHGYWYGLSVELTEGLKSKSSTSDPANFSIRTSRTNMPWIR